MNRAIIAVIIFFSAAAVTKAQFQSFAAGGSIGMGNISSEGVSALALTGSAMLEFETVFWEDIFFRLGYTYAQKINRFLPEDREGRYYPFLKMVTLKALIRQKPDKKIFIEQSAGITAISNHISNLKWGWEYGAGFALGGGLDFTNFRERGFMISLQMEYDLAVTGQLSDFFSVSFQTVYKFY